MASGVELATAWIRLVPSVEGISESVTKALVPAGDAAEKEGQRVGGRMSAGMKVGFAAAAAGVVAGFAGLYQVGATMDDVTDTIRVGTGASGDALKGLTDVAKNVASTVPAEFTAIGTTVADLNTRLGLSGETLQTVASQYLEAGRILGEDVDVQQTSAAFNAFKIEGDGVSAAMDTLFQVSQATGVGMNQLAAGVQANAPALQNLGFSFEDTVALVGSLDKAGLNANAVMASMSKGLVTLAKDGEEPQAAFQRVTSELQGFVEQGDTAAALDLASQVFGTRGASQFVGALQSGALNMEDLMGATGATGDTILGVGAETADFAEKWQVVMNQATLAVEPLATAIFTGLGDALTGVMPFLQDLGAWVGENTQVIGIIAAVIGVTLVAAFVAWTVSIWAATAALLANPITWIVIAIVALMAAIVLLAMNWEHVAAWISEVWGGFISWITDVIDGFVGWWNDMWAGVAGFFTDTWNNLVFVVQVYIALIRTVITTVVTAIAAVWNSIWSGIASFFGGIWDGIVNAVTAFGGFFRSAFDGIAGFVRTSFNAVLGAVKGPINAIISLVNQAIGGLNQLKVTIPAWVPGVGGQTFGLNLPRIPMLAEGGTILRGGSVIVGERGPEMLRLPQGAVVDPDISGGDGTAIEVGVNGEGLMQFLDVYMRETDGTRRLIIENGKKVSG